MEWISIVCLIVTIVIILWRFILEKEGYPFLVALLLLMAFLFYLSNEKSNRFNDWVGDINLRQVSVIGLDIFERKIRITYENGKLVSVVAVPKTIVKIETPEPEKKVEGK